MVSNNLTTFAETETNLDTNHCRVFLFIDVKKGEHTFFCTDTINPKLNINIKCGEIVYINAIYPLILVKI